MIPILLTGPAVEPLTLVEMKAYLRLDGTAEDDLVATLVTAARLTVEAHSRRILNTQTWRLVLDAWPAGGTVRVPLAPFAGLVAARVFDAAGMAETVPVEAFVVDTKSEPGRVILSPAVPGPGRPVNGIELDVSAGYGPAAADVPMPLRQAVRMVAARWFDHRGDEPSLDGPMLADVALIAPYRRARL